MVKNYKLKFIFFSCLFLLISCGKSNEEKIAQALTSAENCLTIGDYQCALDKINAIEEQPRNALYIKIKASAYLGRAGYKSTTFLSNDASNINATNFLSSLTTFSTSQNMTGPTDSRYEDITTAINTLVYAGGLNLGENPSASKRAAIFTTKEATEINSLLLFVSLVQMGKYFFYYGNTNATGTKGAGGTGEPCMFNYTDGLDAGALNTALAAAQPLGGGSCNADNGLAGIPALDGGGGVMHAVRACQGIVLFNNFVDALANVVTGDVSTALDTVKTAINTALGAVPFDNTNSDITELTSQTKCEADFTGETDLERFFGYIFETFHNRP